MIRRALAATQSVAACALIWIAVFAPAAVAALNAQEQELAAKVASAPGQQRPFVEIDPILSAVAHARAVDMARRNYFDHTNPDGHAANYLVRQAGYALPSYYDTSPAGNNIESIAAGYTSVSEVWAGWMKSAGHKRHILAEDADYQPQTSLGVGYYADAKSEFGTYWVILTAPPNKPTLSVAAPAAGARLSAAQVTISGSARGTPQAASVRVRVENADGAGGYITAMGAASWSAVVSLSAGANILRVQSLAGDGSVLLETTLPVRFVVLTPLVVAVEGGGSVTSGFLGTSQREIGGGYTVAARPAAGWLFSQWSGGLSSTAASLAFTMRRDLQLTAHFVPNPFVARAGSYSGLIAAGVFSHSTSGFITVSATTLGALSGRLTFGGAAYALSGKFDAEGQATLSVRRTNLPTLTVALHLDVVNVTDRLTGTVSDGQISATFMADRAGQGSAFAGLYTVAFPAGTQSADAPPGAGYGTLSVGKTGVATLSGALADGTAVSASAAVSKSGAAPLYAALYSTKGSLFAELDLPPPGAGAFGGSYHWTKPTVTTGYHRLGFSVGNAAIGSRFTALTAAQTIPTAGSAVVTFSGGNLDPVTQPATVAANNRVTFSAPILKSSSLTIYRTNGRFYGSFIHPVSKVARRFDGVLLQEQNVGYGFFLGTTLGGSVRFLPAN